MFTPEISIAWNEKIQHHRELQNDSAGDGNVAESGIAACMHIPLSTQSAISFSQGFDVDFITSVVRGGG